MGRYTLLILLLAGCGTELLTTRQHAYVVEPGEVFTVQITEHKALDADILPRTRALPAGFTLNEQTGRVFIFQATNVPGAYTIPYRFVMERNGEKRDVSVDGEIVVNVSSLDIRATAPCNGPLVTMDISNLENAADGTVSTSAYVSAATGEPIEAILRRKDASGNYRVGDRTVTFSHGNLAVVGTVSKEDFTAYPILEVDVQTVNGVASTDPADDWSCNLNPI